MKTCNKCKEEIKEGANSCKHCGADQRNWFIRHKFITAILVIIVLAIIFNAGSDDSTTSEKSNTTAEIVEETKVYGLDEEVTINNIKYTILKVENLGSSVPQSYGDPITTGGTFIKIQFKVENTGNDAEYMGSMKILDNNDREFGESDNIYSILGDDAEFLDQLNPNIPTEYATVFDVALDAKDLKLRINTDDIFSTDFILFELGINAQ